MYTLDSEPNALAQLAIRAKAEHFGSLRLKSLPLTALDLNLDGAGPQPTPTRGDTKFTFTQNVHAELLLSSEEDVVALVETLRRELGHRGVEIGENEVLAYVDRSLEDGDAEWVAVLGSRGHEVEPWGKVLRRFRERK